MKVWVRAILYTLKRSYTLLHNFKHFYASFVFIWSWTLLYGHFEKIFEYLIGEKKNTGEKWPSFLLGDQILTGLKF